MYTLLIIIHNVIKIPPRCKVKTTFFFTFRFKHYYLSYTSNHIINPCVQDALTKSSFICSKGSDPPLTPCQKVHNMSPVGIKTLKVGMQHLDLVSRLLIALLSQNCHNLLENTKLLTYYLSQKVISTWLHSRRLYHMLTSRVV